MLDMVRDVETCSVLEERLVQVVALVGGMNRPVSG